MGLEIKAIQRTKTGKSGRVRDTMALLSSRIGLCLKPGVSLDLF